METSTTQTSVGQRLCIPGGAGFIGRAVSEWFAGRGWEVIILSRRPAAVPGAARVVMWDGRTIGPWAAELDGTAAVLNLAGRTVNCRYTPERRRQIYDSRLESTKVLGEAIGRCAGPPPVWLNASTATIYRHATDRPQDEATGEITPDSMPPPDPAGGPRKPPPGWNQTWAFSVDVATKWERAFAEAAVAHTRKVAVRAAIVLGPGAGGPFDVLDRVVRFGLGGTIAPGSQYMSWVHIGDFCRAIEFLIDRPDLSGAVNVVAPNALPNRDFMRAWRRARRKAVGLPAARWMMEAASFVLRTESELVLKSRWVYPRRLLDAGFRFDFPDWPGAIADLIRRADRPAAGPDSSLPARGSA